MKWYLLVLLLISYPIAELSRLVIDCWNYYREAVYLFELTGMWLSFFAGIIIIAWRLKYEVDT